jgi:phosphoglycerate-specific signal transduction histidine kinase
MKLSLRSRLAAMVLVIFLLAATIVGSAAITWRQVRSLRRHFSGQLEKSSITLSTAASVDATIRGDPDQLKQVLLNLVRNAAESIGERGQITLCLRTERTSLDGRLLDAAILEVVDTGKGIPREVQKRLFDPFYTTKAAGTGWIGWVEEVPGVNAQERSHEELLASLRAILAEALEFNRNEARAAAESGFEEEYLSV